MKLIRIEKIGDPDNIANYYTKPVTTAVMNHYFDYMVPRIRSPSSTGTANAVVSGTGTPCDIAGIRSGDMVRIGGRINDDRVFKFISAEWDHKSGDCYAFVQAPDATDPIRVIASGIAKIKAKL